MISQPYGLGAAMFGMTMNYSLLKFQVQAEIPPPCSFTHEHATKVSQQVFSILSLKVLNSNSSIHTHTYRINCIYVSRDVNSADTLGYENL